MVVAALFDSSWDVIVLRRRFSHVDRDSTGFVSNWEVALAKEVSCKKLLLSILLFCKSSSFGTVCAY